MRITLELRDRTKRYASEIIRFYADLPKERTDVDLLGEQLLQSGVSLAVYAREASRARSDEDFCLKLDSLLREADRSDLYLELLRDDCDITADEVYDLINETSEIIAIFTSIVSRMRRNIGR